MAVEEPVLHHMGSMVQVGKRLRMGGRYAPVALINRDGAVRPSPSPFPLVVSFPKDISGLVTPGSLWLVDGPQVITSYTDRKGDTRYERTIKATRATFVKPTGQTLARWLRENIDGIGEVLSNRLVRHKQLGKWVQEEDRDSLIAVPGMSKSTVNALLENWPSASLLQVIEFLDQHVIPAGISRSVVKALGEGALTILKEHPFMLLGMGVPFAKVAVLAQQLGFTFDDPEIVAGVAAHVAFVHSEETGSTVIAGRELRSRAERLSGKPMPENIGDIAVEHRLMVKVSEGAYQSYGCALMEQEVAHFLVRALLRRPGDGAGQEGCWEAQIDRLQAVKALEEYEEKSLNFALEPEQREAVLGALLAPVCGISGGAGTGKTTILAAVLGCYELLAPTLPNYQVAIAGKAAQRMAHVTNRPAQTIAKLISEHMGERKPELPSHLLLVIDESSMLDLLSMYQLARFLPFAVRIIFVGDVMQLAPVGKGLVFHALKASKVPFFELTEPRRQCKLSGIYRIATDFRNGIAKLPPPVERRLVNSPDCALEESNDPDRLVDLWLQAGPVEKKIVLCPIAQGPLGVDNINRLLQGRIGLDRVPLLYFDKDRGCIPWVTRQGTMLLEGDPVLVTANHYHEDADIRNGDLGILEDVERACIGESYGTLKMVDGRRISVTLEVLEKLNLGYAITIHKSQGSQWPTCFITLPLSARGMIDQSLLYTAITRAQRQTLLLGCPELIRIGIARGPASLERVTTLSARIRHLISLRKD